jgi:iron complex transport system substrate-binding protein
LYQPRTDRSRNRALAAAALALVATLGCGANEGSPASGAPQRIDPDVFRTLPLPKVAEWRDDVPADAPRRIVSVIPSVTEVLFTLGLGDRVVGRSDWCDWPPEVETRPSLGNQQTLSVERVADLRPDLVVFWKHLPDKTARLEGIFRLNVVTPGTETRQEVFDGIAQVAAACRVPGRGRALVSHVQERLDQVSARYRGRPKPRVLLVLDRGQSIYVPGRDSFLQELLDICNAENVAATLDAGTWPAVSIEQVLDWNPGVVLDLSLGAAATAAEVAEAHRFWRRHGTLAAVKAGRIVVLNAGVLVRPGPRLAAVALELARIVHDAP